MRRLLFTLACTLIPCVSAYAGSEQLDATFSKITIGFPNFNYKAVAALTLPNGNVTVVFEYPHVNGICNDTVCIGLYRLDTNGVPLSNAYVIKQANLSSVTAAAVDHLGRIVVVGAIPSDDPNVNDDFGVLRFLPNGADDTSFNNSGSTRIAFNLGGSNNDIPRAVTIDRSDNIVVAGSVAIGNSNSIDADFGVARLLGSNGQLDVSFGSDSRDGKKSIAFDLHGPNPDRANAVAVGNDGKIVLGGIAWDSTLSQNRAVLARLTADGTEDSSLCPPANNACTTGSLGFTISTGRLVYYFGDFANVNIRSDAILSLDVAGNGDIVIAGSVSNPANAAVALLQANGFELHLRTTMSFPQYTSVRFVDAPGTRVLTAGVTANLRLGANQFLLQAFDQDLSPLGNYGNCQNGNSSLCFAGAAGEFDLGPNTSASLSLDSRGRPLFTGTFGGFNLNQSVLVQRITNNTGPKPDQIFRNGFEGL